LKVLKNISLGHISLWGSACFLCFFYQELFLGRTYLFSDHLLGVIPALIDIVSAASPEARYLWTKNLLFGASYAHMSPPAYFHFPEFFLLQFFSPILAINISIAFYVIVSLVSLWFFLRRFLKSEWACTLGSIAYTFSTPMTQRTMHCGFLEAMFSLPLAILLCELYLEKKQKYLLFLLSLVLANAVFVGHPQIFFYLFLATLAYLFVRQKQIFSKEKWIKLFYEPVYLSVLVVLIAAAWLLPMCITYWELAKDSVTTLVTPDMPIGELSFWNFIWLMISPLVVAADTAHVGGRSIIFHSWEIGFYAGLPTLILASFSFSERKKVPAWFAIIGFLIFSFFLLWMRFPSTPEIFSIFYSKIPVLGKFHYSGRAFFLATFSLSVLASFGLEKILKENINGRSFSFLFYWLLFLCTAFFLIIYVNKNELHYIRWITLPLYQSGIIAIFSLVILYLLLRIKKYRSILLIILLTILSIDIITMGLRSKPTIDANELIKKPKFADYIKDERYITWQKDTIYARRNFSMERILPSLVPNTGLYFGLQSVDGYVSPFLQDHFYIFYDMIRARLPYSRPKLLNFNLNIDHSLQLLRMSGVRFIVTDQPLPDLPLVSKDENQLLYALEDVKEKFISVEKIAWAPGPLSALKLLSEQIPNLPKTAVIANEEQELWMKEALLPIKSDLLRDDPLNTTLKIEAAGPSFLVFTESFRNEWKAFLNGKEVKVFLTNGIFRGVRIPDKGIYTLEFRYEDNAYKIGKIISLFSLFIIISYILVNVSLPLWRSTFKSL